MPEPHPRVYCTPSLPLHWIMEDVAGQRWIVPLDTGAWTRRTPYRGPTAGLIPATPAIATLARQLAGAPETTDILAAEATP